MKFNEALRAMLKGKKVKADCWDPNEYIMLDTDNNDFIDEKGDTYTFSNLSMCHDWEECRSLQGGINMKYSSAEKQIKALSSKYDIDMGDGDFNVAYNGNAGSIYVDGSYEYGLSIGDVEIFSGMPFSNKLYMILSELAATPLDERVEEKKHYVKVFDGILGYLNIDNSTGQIIVYARSEGYGYKTKFTDKEIEQLKQRDNIPLDWSKVTFEDAE